MNQYLAQVNIAKMLAPLESPVMVDFVNNLDRINALAESSEGFIWRLKEEANNATSIRIGPVGILICLVCIHLLFDLLQLPLRWAGCDDGCF